MSRRASTLAAYSVVAALALAAVAGFWWPLPEPIGTGTVVFYTPHPDDETYGMAQAIQANVAAGRHVIVVALTDGEGSLYVRRWHNDMDGNGTADMWDFGLYRRLEFRNAMAALGVSDVRFFGAAASRGASGFRNGTLTASEVASAVASVSAGYPHVTDFATMGYIQGDPVFGDYSPHPDHSATFEGVLREARALGSDAGFFKVYVYSAPWWMRVGPFRVSGGTVARTDKKKAVAAYHRIGSESTPMLFQEALRDRGEYFVPLWLAEIFARQPTGAAGR